ncbi:MAG: GGDEF domain-containing protein [Rubrivivax sp.]|nr:GGDEF domain-containing protein [Rubrivivax sp.]
MFHVDPLSAYLNCGVAALVGAAIMRAAETDDLRLRRALRICGWALVTLGVGLLPAGLGAGAAHPVAQLSLAIGSLAGVVLMAHGLGQVQGRDMPTRWVWALLAGLGLVHVAALVTGPLIFGQVYALGLAATATLMAWQGRGFVVSPRNLIERGLGLSLLLVAASSWLRLAFTLAYIGPARVDLLYVPVPVSSLLAALYGVMPITMATLLLTLVNARLHQQLHSRATTDELTGALTRRALRELAPAMLERTPSRQAEVAVLMIDLDHFKGINDSCGHAVGDRVLKMAASTLQVNLRPDALLARYGGEEFVAVLPIDDLPAARRVSERLRAAVEGVDWKRAAGLDRAVTVSVGVALAGAGETLDAVLQRADEALYRAKREGRNQVQVSLMAAWQSTAAAPDQAVTPSVTMTGA